MKFTIDNDAIADEFLEDAILLGIVAPVNDYLFCWLLNQHLGFDFKINNDCEIQLNKKKRTYFFSVYDYVVPAASLVHYLYNNQFDGEYLLPEFKHLDFLWLLKGEVSAGEELKQLIRSIRALPGVQLVIEIPREQIKNKQHLII
jgi:hypothetical protein